MAATQDVYIVAGARTAFGRYGGGLSHIRLDDLLGIVLNAACERASVPREQVDEIAAGCVNVAHEGMGDLARWSALAAGFPDSVPGYTLNRFCASSLTCAIQIADAIRSGTVGIGVAGGAESMSRSGWAFMKGEAPFMPRGPLFLLDTMWAGAGGPPHPALLARDAYIDMIRTAQNVADRWNISREEMDAYALRSHQRAAAATESGRFAEEIVAVDAPTGRRGETVQVLRDESIRGDTSLEQLAKLPPQPGTKDMTAGNSSPLSDGASAVVLAGATQVESLGVQPLARVLGAATVAVDPLIMGIAPAYAMPIAVERSGLRVEDVDVYEIHEAFAAQALAVRKEFATRTGFDLPDERVTPNGGAVAIGHPFGATGTRYLLSLAHQLRATGARYGCVGVCVGSGQGVALVIERAA
jgi:acetyl-CoA acetyltransferase family protein